MDYELSAIIKKEKENIFKDDDNDFTKLCFDIGIKVETDPDIDDWRIRKVLSDYQEARINVELKKENSKTCIVCHKYFPNSHSLYKHNLIHLTVSLIKRKFFMCDACPKFCMKKKSLENHIKMKHQPKKQFKRVKGVTKCRHTCRICNKTYSYTTWFEHMKNVHGDSKVKCEDCDAVFKCMSYLKRHVKCKHKDRINKSEQTWECPKCPSNFKNKAYLTKHLRNCHSEKTFQCKICKSILKSKPYLLAHMLRVHYDDGMVHSCNICGKIFKSPRYVNVHKINSHSSKVLKK